MGFVRPARRNVSGALRTLEGLLSRHGRDRALRNAWAAVQEDRERAVVRSEAERALTAVTRGAAPAALPASRP